MCIRDSLQGGIPDLPGLLAEDGPEQALLGGQVGLALGGDLAHQDIAGTHLGAHPDDAPVSYTHLLKDGRAKRVYMAKDADPRLLQPLVQEAVRQRVPLIQVDTMRQLGEACGISVGAAIVAAV